MGERAVGMTRPDHLDDISGTGAFDSLTPEGTGLVSATNGTSESTEPEALASEIEQTRSDLTETLDAIQERLAPERITGQAVDAASEVTEQARDAALEVAEYAIREATEQVKVAVRELTDQARAAVREATVGRVERVASNANQSAQGVGASVTQLIKQNPGAAALTGLGLGWMWMSRSGGSSGSQPMQSAQQTAGSAVGQVQEVSGRIAGQVQHSTGHIVDQVQETTGQVVSRAEETVEQAGDQLQYQAHQMQHQVQHQAHQVKHQVQRARTRFQQTLNQNPLPMGVLAVAVGGATALLAPTTQRESQLVGEARDQVVDRVETAAQGAVEKVQQVTEEALDAAGKEAKYQGLTEGS
ncbi:MAG: DUF3618 domain-containing protein [Chloroflexota bacterium]|nr:DUF3618 domain-containing protein [Chloroflexota bacterium]